MRVSNSRHYVVICVIITSFVLGVQLISAVAWAADTTHMGPAITIVQLSQDEDSNWAVEDLRTRLSKFITDDPFFPDRIKVLKTSDPYVAEYIDDRFIVYVSHGGPLGIVTGRYLTSWEQMAKIVENSPAFLHLFTACSSKNIIRYGSEDTEKRIYVVPGARPAEVTNVEITASIMLRLALTQRRLVSTGRQNSQTPRISSSQDRVYTSWTSNRSS